MSKSISWHPPLPSLGRAAPTVAVSVETTLLERYQQYFLEIRSSPNIFIRRCPATLLRGLRIPWNMENRPPFLADLDPVHQYRVIMASMWCRDLSAHFQRKVLTLCKSGKLNCVREWFNTADAVVLPYLIGGGESYELIDRMTRFSFENCANNYEVFAKRLKTLKKQIRKEFALGRDTIVPCRDVVTYYDAYRLGFPSRGTEHQKAQYVMLWCQTRAFGMADSAMIQTSIKKFEEVVTQPSRYIKLNDVQLMDVTGCGFHVNPLTCRVSVGPAACLESGRKDEGKTGFVKMVTRTRCLKYRYDFDTLEIVETYDPPRPVRSPDDLLHYSVQECLNNPIKARTVRLHCISDTAKARCITVASGCYQVLQGVMAHLFAPAMKARGIRSGMKADRHLWNFVHKDLHPQNPGAWEHLSNGEVFALSTDLETATDFGNKSVARQIYGALVQAAVTAGAPRALLTLAKTLFCSSRVILIPNKDGGYRYIRNTRGWFMGDMMTKVIMTLAHDYAVRTAGIRVYSLVGDDLIALSNRKEQLSACVNALTDIDFKISEDDTFVSSRLAFYCEEGTLVPQRASDSVVARLRRNQDLTYLDYPRVRLLLPLTIETDSYSYSNNGRTSLLGKECKWVKINNSPAVFMFDMATMLQKCLLRQEADVICPFLPTELGGDGSFPSGPAFLEKVVTRKSRNCGEVVHRMHGLLRNELSFRFVRSDRLDFVVHKHHILLDKVKQMAGLLPPEAVVIPDDPQKRVFLSSLRLPFLEPASITMLRLLRDAYYSDLFKGKNPIEPKFDLDRQFVGGRSEVTVNFTDFFQHWKNPGFKFTNSEPFFVKKEHVVLKDPVHVRLFERRTSRIPRMRILADIYKDWMSKNLDITDLSLEEIRSFVETNAPLSRRVLDRMNLFGESDSYILLTLQQHDTYAVITCDVKLCERIAQYARAKWGKTPKVAAVHPAIYMTGRLCDCVGLPDDHLAIEDPGAMMHVDLVEFQDGFPLDELIWDRPVRSFKSRSGSVDIYRLMGHDTWRRSQGIR